MTDFDLAAIVAEIAGDTPMTLVEAGSPEVARVPEPWRAIASSADAATRASAAVALWNPEFLALVPRFAEVFRERLEDVRVCRLGDDWVLLYLAGDSPEGHVAWIGWEPGGTTTQAPFWEAIPLPARDFLTGVHAGFTGPDWQSHGLIPPRWMQTFADWAEFDDETIEEWNDEWTVAVDRMTLVTTNASLLYHCVSPDAPGRMVLVYEGDVDDRPEFGEALDELMSERFES
ncbi:hypothetical protein [Lentzea albidocapillata]|uniref:Uncharacterized protein n=1 Tax=Lentzea albidocapillata TaxID=40571 RepID=A0A1W2FEJ0_9PSEU|nr:hypothetical protein [Lentzea albidocapillata]SMD19968.1 hypothetical protein SAMN05660733_05759 [Lentzea albidocapillata]